MARTVSFLILVEALVSCSTRLAMTGLRLILLTELLCLTFSSTFMLVGTTSVAAQSQIPEVKSSLITAFESIQTAEQRGATNQSLAPLISELNQALGYATLAEQTNSTTAAVQAIALSNDVSMKAESLGNQAQSGAQQRTLIAYFIALALALLTSIGVLEASRLRRFLARKKFLRSRIQLGEARHVA